MSNETRFIFFLITEQIFSRINIWTHLTYKIIVNGFVDVHISLVSPLPINYTIGIEVHLTELLHCLAVTYTIYLHLFIRTRKLSKLLSFSERFEWEDPRENFWTEDLTVAQIHLYRCLFWKTFYNHIIVQDLKYLQASIKGDSHLSGWHS